MVEQDQSWLGMGGLDFDAVAVAAMFVLEKTYRTAAGKSRMKTTKKSIYYETICVIRVGIDAFCIIRARSCDRPTQN
jgi:hypothetical protein